MRIRIVSQPPSQETPSPSPTILVTQAKTITFNSERYAYAYFIVQNPTKLSLIPNFSSPKDAESLMNQNDCVSAINGGFYDKSNKPLGYFQSGETVLGPRIESALINGFLWANASGSAVISSELPRTDFHFALQTGPILIFDGNTLPLSINNDTHARRMVAAKNNELIFLTIYNADSVFEGPLLENLPAVVKEIGSKERMNIRDAVNLDGGSASAFYSEDTSLSELTPVGSLFCLKS